MSKKLKYQIDETIKVLKNRIKDIDAVEKYSGELSDNTVMKPPFQSPEPGDLPAAGAELLSRVYSKCRSDGGEKESCAKIAWTAVRNAGYKSINVTNILKAVNEIMHKAIDAEEPVIEVEEPLVEEKKEQEKPFSILEEGNDE